MGKKHTFRAAIEDAGKGGVYVRIPFDVEKTFGRKRVAVKATLSGEPYRGSLVRMGTDYHVLGVLKAIRERIGAGIGDEIEVTLEKDTEPREVGVPPYLAGALSANPKAEAGFARLAYSHKKKYLEWIEEAKKPDTRKNRIARMVKTLEHGKDPD